MSSSSETIKEILSEAKKLKEADRQLLLKELRIRRLLAENKPIVRARRVKPISLEEINEIKHLSRKGHAK
ncbi:MAG TPA: hypothetical protein VHS53_02650 [Mucilaginibacter sp.]|nr:hypothetical protein [Mucilaginibacter sp.]